MPKTNNRRAHAEALRARERADGQIQFRFAARVLAASAVAGAAILGSVAISPQQVQSIGKYGVADLSAFLLADVFADPLMTITWQGQADRTGVKEWAVFQPLRDEAIGFAESLSLGGVLGLALGVAVRG